MKMPTNRIYVDELLMRGCDGWISAGEVVGVVGRVGLVRSSEEQQRLSFAIVSEVLQEGLMEIGDIPLNESRRLKLWPIGFQECLDRAASDLKSLRENPTPFWLQNTGKGNELGNWLLSLWNEPRNCAETLLMRGAAYGHVSLEWVEWLAERIGGAAPRESRSAAMALIRKVVEAELMEIGDFSEGGRHFTAWPMVAAQEPLDRLEREWSALGQTVSPAQICRLRNTYKGNALGEEALERWNADGRMAPG